MSGLLSLEPHQYSIGHHSDSDGSRVRVPLLLDPVPTVLYDIQDERNLSCGIDCGSGVFLTHCDNSNADTAACVSHRMTRPFPLCSLLRTDTSTETASNRSVPDPASSDHFFGCSSDRRCGAQYQACTVPLLLGEIPAARPHDPVYSNVHAYHCINNSSQAVYKLSKGKARMAEQLEMLKNSASGVQHLTGLFSCVSNMSKFLIKNPIFTGWDSMHNWLYSGGCLSVMYRHKYLVRPYGDDIAVTRLPDIPLVNSGSGRAQLKDPGPGDNSTAFTDDNSIVEAESQSQLLENPRSSSSGAVHQTHAVDHADDSARFAVRYLYSASIYQVSEADAEKSVDNSLLTTSNNTSKHSCIDSQASIDSTSPSISLMDSVETCSDDSRGKVALSSVLCHPMDVSRWLTARTDGRVQLRDLHTRRCVHDVQIAAPGGRAIDWYGLTATCHSPHVFHVATRDSIYTLDDRMAAASLSFCTSMCPHCFSPADRLHAVSQSQGRHTVTLFTSSRHLNGVDERYMQRPLVRARLSVPQPPLLLQSAPWRSQRELVVVASTADRHVQCVALDWRQDETPCQTSMSRLLECPLEALQSPLLSAGIEADARAKLTTVGLACATSDKNRMQVLSANWYGDVFTHPLIARKARKNHVRIDTSAIYRRSTETWCRRLEQQQMAHARHYALPCHNQVDFNRPLKSLLGLPAETYAVREAIDTTNTAQMSGLNRRATWRTRWLGSRSDTDTHTDNSRLSSAQISDMMSEWETEAEDSPPATPVRHKSTTRTLPQAAHSLKRAKKRLLSSRRRRSLSSSVCDLSVTSAEASCDESDASVAPSVATPSGDKVNQSVSSPRTPSNMSRARPSLPPTPASAYKQFSLDLFDD